MSRRYVVLLALLLAGLIGGCRASRAPLPGQPAQAAPTVAGQTSLRLATFDGGPTLNPYQTIIAEYQKDNPKTVVYLDATAPSDYLARLQESAAAAPDIVQVNDGMIQKLVGQRALADLAPTLAACGLDPAVYLPNVATPGRIDGKQVLLPQRYTPLVVYYNKKLFKQFNVAEPKDGWTWDDFLATAQALKRRSATNKQLWGVELPAAWADGFEALALANGGRLVSEDGTQYVGYMDSDAVAEALQFYADLYQKQKVAPPPVDAAQIGGGNAQFENGEAAMRFGDRSLEAALRKNPSIDLGIVGLPAGKERANVLFWDGLGVMASSTSKEDAGRFLCALAGPQSADVWKDWGLPTMSLADGKNDVASDSAVWLGELPYVKPRAAATTAWWAETGQAPLARAIQQVITGHAAAKDALTQAAKDAQAALDQKLQR
ncbi:MAG: sugar ABC transporter substrate-binding protein [Anaerolineae bacterium]